MRLIINDIVRLPGRIISEGGIGTLLSNSLTLFDASVCAVPSRCAPTAGFLSRTSSFFFSLDAFCFFGGAGVGSGSKYGVKQSEVKIG